MLSKKAKRREEARLQELKDVPAVQPVGGAAQHRTPVKEKLVEFFDANSKKLMLIPTLLLLLAVLQIGYQVATTGDFATRSVSLSGGAQITVLREGIDTAALESALRTQYPEWGIAVSPIGRSGVAITARSSDAAQAAQLVQALATHIPSLTPAEYAVEIVGASLGESFFRQTMIALLIAFCFMSIVVFISFRSAAPSLFVVLAALSDIVTTLAIFNLAGYELTTASIAAFLMLIGYSIDTDVLLTSRVLRRKEGTVAQATISAFKTGATMSVTTMGATLIGLFLTKSELLRQIMFIIFTGVLVDMAYTWCYNAPILKWYLGRKGVQHG